MSDAPKFRDYSLDGPEGKKAVEKGLANAQWFVPEIDRKDLRRLMQRDDWHATRDTIILFSIIIGFGYLSYYYWIQQNWVNFTICFLTYCVFYCSSADSRWHETGHATAFKYT